MPMMMVAGDHANNDMAGAEPDSHKSILEAAGYKVDAYIHGIGENPAIQPSTSSAPTTRGMHSSRSDAIWTDISRCFGVIRRKSIAMRDFSHGIRAYFPL